MTGENGKPDFEDGPIELPSDANCSECHYSTLISVPDENGMPRLDGQKQRICRRFPPSMVPFTMMEPGSGRAVQTMVPVFPVVDASLPCFEFEYRDGPEVIPTALFGANDETGDES